MEGGEQNDHILKPCETPAPLLKLEQEPEGVRRRALGCSKRDVAAEEIRDREPEEICQGLNLNEDHSRWSAIERDKMVKR